MLPLKDKMHQMLYSWRLSVRPFVRSSLRWSWTLAKYLSVVEGEFIENNGHQDTFATSTHAAANCRKSTAEAVTLGL